MTDPAEAARRIKSKMQSPDSVMSGETYVLDTADIVAVVDAYLAAMEQIGVEQSKNALAQTRIIGLERANAEHHSEATAALIEDLKRAAKKPLDPSLTLLLMEAIGALRNLDSRIIGLEAMLADGAAVEAALREALVDAQDMAIHAREPFGSPRYVANNDPRWVKIADALSHPSPSPTSGWRPIESAPKGSVLLLGWQGRSYMALGQFTYGHWNTFGDGFSPDPTHWQPLPASPSPTDGRE